MTRHSRFFHMGHVELTDQDKRARWNERAISDITTVPPLFSLWRIHAALRMSKPRGSAQ